VSDSADPMADPWRRLRAFTSARIGMDRCGDGIATAALLQFQLDHALARDAVNRDVDFSALDLGDIEHTLRVHSAAPDRATYIRRPDLGRCLDDRSRSVLSAHHAAGPWDAVFIIADGLSSAAVHDHAAATLHACLARLPGWRLAPIVCAEQARVALGDEIGALFNASLSVVLIGERPGLSVANSLGIYLTWQPRVGRHDAERNCISNIHAGGLSCEHAADKACWLMTEARHRRISGTVLKEDAALGDRIETVVVPIVGRLKHE
jgi:ethanolamine ammonia-lyase small subunit